VLLVGAAAGLSGAPRDVVAQVEATPFRIVAPDVEPTIVAEIEADLAWAESRIESLLGPFPDTVSVRIFADRAGFSAGLRDAWGIPETACWMVGAADDFHLYLLSPGVWEDEACEHDPTDAEHRRLLVTHETVHVYHGQVNPSEDVGLLEEIGWFVEGLATWASGQLETAHAGRAAEAIAAGEAPAELAEAWSGPYRYGVSGSLVAWIDDHWGREAVREALAFTSWDEFEARLGMTEPEFLAGWETWVTRD
jgi:hypothetical protein